MCYPYFKIWRTLKKGPSLKRPSVTDGSNILHTLLVKYYNDLLDRQSSERGKNEVTYFYVGDVFCIHLGAKYADFLETLSIKQVIVVVY